MKKFYLKTILMFLSIIGVLILGCDQANIDNSTVLNQDSSSRSGVSSTANGADQSVWPPKGFSEQSADQNTAFPDSAATAVTVYAPLPSSFPAHPAACDNLNFLRVRHKNGPANPSDAARILIAQPGILEGASAFYNIASNLVTRAYSEKGKYIEFWIVDRRPNGLEDLNGLKLAKSTGDPHDYIDYYYRNKSYKGKRFKGFLNPLSDAKWLVDMGMDQTVKDWNAIITRGIPNQEVRRQKVYLGGHSLGGIITGCYACWDFDGDPETTADAGYNQCAGYFALDSTVSAAPMGAMMLGTDQDNIEILGDIPANVIDLMRTGLFERFVSVPGIVDPEVMNLLTGLGFAAQAEPTGESDLVGYMPATQKNNLTYRFYHSRNLSAFLAPTPTIKYFRYTNQAMLALFTDDNSMPLSFVQVSLGFFTGGPVADKEFPVIEGQVLAIPTDSGGYFTKGPLYGWLNFNELGGVAIPNSAAGVPFTTPDNEVTDINDFARSVGALPMDFVEKYFPVRLAVDAMFGTDGAVHGNGVDEHPVINIKASDGPLGQAEETTTDSPVVFGYNHIDVMTAAPVQNDGQLEPVATYLLDFIFK